MPDTVTANSYKEKMRKALDNMRANSEEYEGCLNIIWHGVRLGASTLEGIGTRESELEWLTKEGRKKRAKGWFDRLIKTWNAKTWNGKGLVEGGLTKEMVPLVLDKIEEELNHAETKLVFHDIGATKDRILSMVEEIMSRNQ